MTWKLRDIKDGQVTTEWGAGGWLEIGCSGEGSVEMREISDWTIQLSLFIYLKFTTHVTHKSLKSWYNDDSW